MQSLPTHFFLCYWKVRTINNSLFPSSTYLHYTLSSQILCTTIFLFSPNATATLSSFLLIISFINRIYFSPLVFRDRISLCRPGCLGIHKRAACFCLPSSGIKGLGHYWLARFYFYFSEVLGKRSTLYQQATSPALVTILNSLTEIYYQSTLALTSSSQGISGSPPQGPRVSSRTCLFLRAPQLQTPLSVPKSPPQSLP